MGIAAPHGSGKSPAETHNVVRIGAVPPADMPADCAFI